MIVFALVPMKHESQRVSGKNYRLFNGKPLYTHILDTLISCECIDGVVVNTDSKLISRGINDRYDQVLVLPRPHSLCGNNVPMNEILLHDVANTEADVYIQTHSTNPILSVKTIDAAIKTYIERSYINDSLFSVTRLQSRLWDWRYKPINHDVEVLLNTQDLQPVYEENSCIYIFTGKLLRQRRNRIGYKPYLFEMDAIEAMDIDTLIDFKVAEALYRERTIEENTNLITPITAGIR